MIRAAVICVPARNEARRLPVLLEALAAQEAPGPIKVALCINNSNALVTIYVISYFILIRCYL